MQTVNYPIDKLIFAEYNPRQLTKDQYKDLKDSITRFGLVDPMIVNTHKQRKNILVGGHQRVRVAKDLGFEEVPCVEVKLTLDKEKELNIRLNKNTGEWDYDALANYFDVGELTDWGFTDDELQFWAEEPKEGLIDDDEVPEVEEAITQTGDMWMLGDHKVLCGDATKKEDVERLMDGSKADMVFTDPPYGIDLDTDFSEIMEANPGKVGLTQRKHYKKIIGDDKDFDPSVLLNVFQKVKEVFLWGGDYYSKSLPDGGSWFVWDKRKGIEDVDFTLSEFELCWSKNKHHRKIVRIQWYGAISIGKEDTKKRIHPTQKPIELALWFIEKFNGENIVDPFLGSGSTLIACEKTNRKCYGMEIDPHYCDVIVKRWEEYTRKKAERTERVQS